ncbi:hypothetical protein [Brachybacterium sp. AOP35-5H-19]|uniref:hypothetical protein n=1 Tax=Brachybacterium sp. AOP35-5H-19 TaxID=3457685 RepID=UPI00403361B1
MWVFRVRKVQIALAAVGVIVLVIAGLAVVGHLSNVPDDERIEVRPTSEEPSVVGADDPTQETNPVVLPLPSTSEPQELAPAVAEVLGSADTARFQEAYYVATIAPAAPEIPNEGKAPTTQQQWAQQVVTTAWQSDPWADRAQYKTTDTFTPQKVTTADTGEFLDFFAPSSAEGSAEAREYLTGEGLVVMEVEGTLLRELTDPGDGLRKQEDMGTVSWTVAMLCSEGEDCTVFLAVPGTLSEATEEG